MKDRISIGDRVKVLWNFDNRYHTDKVVDITGDVITVSALNRTAHGPNRRISLTDKTSITKI